MIIPDKKKATGIILAGMDGGISSPVRPEETIDPREDVMMGLAEDLMMAIDQRSASGVASAFKAMMMECEAYESESEQE